MGKGRCGASEGEPVRARPGSSNPALAMPQGDVARHARRVDPGRDSADADGGDVHAARPPLAASQLYREELSPISRQHIDIYQGAS